MGNLSSHEDCETEKPCTGTPACRDVSFLDPRSATLEIVRTPLEVPPTHRSRLRRLVSLLDPRSPSLHVNRTPLQIPREDVKPVEEPEPQEADLNAVDSPEHALVHVDNERPPDHVDLKIARALFFGDMSTTESPAVSPTTKPEPSPIKCEEVEEDIEEETEALAEKVIKSSCQDDKIEPEAIQPVVAMMLPAVAAVKCAELTTTPTVLPRRHNKENALKKQLFHTPDKTRVRTPLSNVSSFHNSPLLR